MNSIIAASWIAADGKNEACPMFRKEFTVKKAIKSATLNITALGIYKAEINGKRIGDYIFAPGWTSYDKRLQYQEYDIAQQLSVGDAAVLEVTLGNGWCLGRLGWENGSHFWSDKMALLASIDIKYVDGETETIYTNQTWQTAPSNILFSELYDGEVVDSRIVPNAFKNAVLYQHGKDMLIKQEGEIIREIQRLDALKLIHTPNDETVIDFGQNLTGYVEFEVKGSAGAACELSFSETLDKQGNFYTENMRSAKNKIVFICNGEKVKYKPNFTFQGFRYIRIDRWAEEIDVHNFTAIAVHSDMKRTGFFECSNTLVNKLFENIIWGQRGNFLDVPTDCPQRDERLGWTGDAQVFIRAASYNYDTEKFFAKWFNDLAADQFEDGKVPDVIPSMLRNNWGSSAWGDAAVICPWQIYLTYGSKAILKKQFASMKKWVDYINAQGDNPYLWNTGFHYGDWLGLDGTGEDGDCNGGTDKHLIATPCFARSTSILIKAGTALGYDMSTYSLLYHSIVTALHREFVLEDRLSSDTQTGYALTTGFVGTPCVLHALAQNGYLELAYKLLVRETYPSWLYAVKQGATTIWEHWDGIKPDGSMWSSSMNSFNHYAYGAVADFMYGVVCGINIDEANPGFRHFYLMPQPDTCMSYAKASIDTRYGRIVSSWNKEKNATTYCFEIPELTSATIILGEKRFEVGSGTHKYTIWTFLR